ncbi:DoxX family protein [Parapedobacter sp. DT-150]|uniref:DoxX family protein n=1 Tax=Parapedobacter sp. DT-150 TaxID=3396162 RepID=UPI003F1AC0B0
MNVIERIEHWGDAHHPRWLDILRIAVGIVIFLKGVTFITNTESLRGLIEETHIQIYTWGAVHYVAFSHLVGGILIAIGLLTRVAIGFQLPILFGAVFFVNITRGLSFLNSELWISIVVLILLLVFFVIGSGPYSLDQQMRERKR